MMGMRAQNEPHHHHPPHANGGAGGSRGGEKVWELRPGGMLVQKRTDEENRVPPPTIRVRVKYGLAHHEIHISSQATFGELKKTLMGPTGLHHEDQKLFYKDKERDSKAFLDVVGVKDKSKIVLQEDPLSREKCYLEMKKSAKMERAAKSISEISLEVDKLGGKVSSIETAIARGEKVVEKDVVSLIELLMNQLLKLDGIAGDGDVKLQRKMQVKRVQKYVETLDVLKMKNSSPASRANSSPARTHGSSSSSPAQQPLRHSLSHSLIDDPLVELSTTNPFLITTQWETFDASPSVVDSAAHSAPSVQTGTVRAGQPSFTWDLL